MKESQSAWLNGWQSYPAERWNSERSVTLVHDVPFWEYCAQKYGDPILDVACGNGRVSIPLAEKGYKVTGIDLNEGLIESAKEYLTKKDGKLDVDFIVGDIVDFRIEKSFGLAIMPDWSFQVLLTQEDQLSFLRRLWSHLRPKGGFAFNFFIPFKRLLGAKPNNATFDMPQIGSSCTFDPITQVEPDRKGEVEIKIRHTTLSELELLFRITGFKIVEKYGDIDRRPFSAKGDNDYMIITEKCEKET